jgi:hypothetical protein
MGGKGSGGANGGPQYNPANVNGLGGNGQSGMNTDYTGFGYGKNKEINEQRTAAPIKSSTPQAYETAPVEPSLPPITPLDAPTQFPNQPVTAGGALGDGPGEEVLNVPKEPTGDVDIDMVRMYYPVMQYWASQPDTPQATKDYVRFLGTII